jgi:murein DD-endopeptidase MepM/ murein hydrolase activator NlpD
MIHAAASGTVTFAGFGSAANCYGGYGNVVVIKNSTTYSTLYAHCSKLIVSTGATVKKGDVIALVGNTGNSQGNHCHFEVQVNGTATDPMPYLNRVKEIEDIYKKLKNIFIY